MKELCLFAFSYSGSMYFYRKNPQGDIIAILDNGGHAVVKYYYDAWENCIVCDANGNEIADTARR